MLQNLMRDRLGGVDTESNMKTRLATYVLLPDYRCQTIEEQNDSWSHTPQGKSMENSERSCATQD